MDPTFTRAISAAQEPQRRCFSVKLRPLTVGHLFVLAEIENCLPDRPDLLTFADLLTAVLVCSQRNHRDARRMLRGRFASIPMKVWGWVMRKRPWNKEAVAFMDYLEEQLGRPESDSIDAGKGEVRAPLCWRLLAMLMADFHFSHEAAMDTPLPFALTLWAVEADRRGVSALASERQLAFRSWVKEMEAVRMAAEAQAGYEADEGKGPL